MVIYILVEESSQHIDNLISLLGKSFTEKLGVEHGRVEHGGVVQACNPNAGEPNKGGLRLQRETLSQIKLMIKTKKSFSEPGTLPPRQLCPWLGQNTTFKDKRHC